jgi:hypothetical protein
MSSGASPVIGRTSRSEARSGEPPLTGIAHGGEICAHWARPRGPVPF